MPARVPARRRPPETMSPLATIVHRDHHGGPVSIPFVRRRTNGKVLVLSEPPVGFEPTTARLRIESSTTELRWRQTQS